MTNSSKELPRVFVDFNAMTEDGKRVLINMKHMNRELASDLKSGFRVLLYEQDMEVEGIVQVEIDDKGIEWWYGLIDWDTQRDIEA